MSIIELDSMERNALIALVEHERKRAEAAEREWEHERRRANLAIEACDQAREALIKTADKRLQTHGTAHCLYCGYTGERKLFHEAKSETLEHGRTCDKHPMRAIERERDELQAFKYWVHAYLDMQGVPHHPPGTHVVDSASVLSRMDWLIEKLHVAERERDEWKEKCEIEKRHWIEDERDLNELETERDELRKLLERWEAGK